jgi:hypothetical protein
LFNGLTPWVWSRLRLSDGCDANQRGVALGSPPFTPGVPVSVDPVIGPEPVARFDLVDLVDLVDPATPGLGGALDRGGSG